MASFTRWLSALIFCLYACHVIGSEHEHPLQKLRHKLSNFQSDLHRTLEGARIRKKRQRPTPLDYNDREEHLRVGSSSPEDLPYLSHYNLTFWVPVRHKNQNQLLIGTREGDMALFHIDDANDSVASMVALSTREDVGIKAQAFSHLDEQWFVLLQTSHGRSWIRTYQRVGRGLEGRQVILLEGESDFDLVTVRGVHYLTVVTFGIETGLGFTYQANVILFHWTNTQFDEISRRPTLGARSVVCWALDASLYVAVGQEVGDKGDLSAGSPIYIYSSKDERGLVLLDVLLTNGPRKVRHFLVGENHYLIFIGHSNGILYWWSSSQFLRWQTMNGTADASDVSVLTLKNGEAVIVITLQEEVLFLTLDSSGYYVVSFTMKLSASVASLQFMFSGRSYFALALFGAGSAKTQSIWKLGFTKYLLPKESSLDPLLQCLSNVNDRLQERKHELDLVNSDLSRVWLSTTNQTISTNVVVEGYVTSRNQLSIVNVVVVTHKTEIPDFTTEDFVRDIHGVNNLTNSLGNNLKSAVLKTTDQVINGAKNFEGSLFVPSFNRGSTRGNVTVNGVSITSLYRHGLKQLGDQVLRGAVLLRSMSAEKAEIGTLNGLDTKELLLLRATQNINGNLQFTNVNAEQLSLGGTLNWIPVDHFVTTVGNQNIKELKSFRHLNSNVIDVQGQINGENLDEIKLKIVRRDGDREITGHLKTDLTVHVTGDLILLGPLNDEVDIARLDSDSVKIGGNQQLKGLKTFPSLKLNGDLSLSGLLNQLDTGKLVTLTTNQTISGSFHFISQFQVRRNLPSHRINGVDLDQEAVLRNSNDPQFITGLRTFSTSITADFVDMTEGVTLDGVDPSLLLQDIVKHQEGVVRGDGNVFHNAVVLGNVTALGGINGFNVYDWPELVWMKSWSQEIEAPLIIHGEWTTEHDLETGVVNRLNLNSDVVHTFGDEVVITEKKFDSNVVVSHNFSLTIGKTINGADFSSFDAENEEMHDKVSGIKVLKSLEVKGSVFSIDVNDINTRTELMIPDAFQTVTGLKQLKAPLTIVSGNVKASHCNIQSYNNIDFSKYIKSAIPANNRSTRNISNKKFLRLRGSELTLSESSRVNSLSIQEMFQRVVTLNTDQHIPSEKQFSSNLSAKLVSAHRINDLDLLLHAALVITVDSKETIRGRNTFARNLKVEDLFAHNAINGINVQALSANVFSKSRENVLNPHMTFSNDVDIGKMVANKYVDGVDWRNLFFLGQDETLTQAWMISHVRTAKDIFVTGLLNGCDLAKLGYQAIYAEKNEQYIIGEWQLESLKVIGDVTVKKQLNTISIEEVKQNVITLSGDQVLTGNVLLTSGIFTSNVNLRGTANALNLGLVMKDAVRHSTPQVIQGYKSFRGDMSATVFTGRDLFFAGVINGVNVIELFEAAVWKRGQQAISGAKSISAVKSVHATVKDYLNGVRLPDDVIQTSTSEHIDSPIYILKDVQLNSDLAVRGSIDGTSLKELLDGRVTLSTEQEITSQLEFLKDSVVFGYMLVDTLNGVVLELVVTNGQKFPLEGTKSFLKDLRVAGAMTADSVNGHDVVLFSYNTITLSNNEVVTEWQHFSKPLLLQNSLSATWINSISTPDLSTKFIHQYHSINSSLEYFTSLNKFIENSLSTQLEASAYQISSFAYFSLIQEIGLGPSSRILNGYRLTQHGAEFSHSMVIWTTVSHCVYEERCCDVAYSYWMRVKNTGIAMVDSDAEIGKYFPIQDLSTSVPEHEFVLWTNATSARCSESVRGEMIVASFAENGRLDVYLRMQNAPILSDVKTFRDGHLYAVAGFYYDKRNAEYSSTIVYAYNEQKREWREHQILSTFGALSLDITTYVTSGYNSDEILLAIGSGMGTLPDSYSSIYRWDDTKRAFMLVQNIPSQYTTSALWVKSGSVQLLLLAGVDSYPFNEAACSILSGGQINIYVYHGKVEWIQSIPLSGVVSMVSFSIAGDVFIAAASSHLQSIVILQWRGYAGFIQIQSIFAQEVRHLNTYWIEDELYLTVASATAPAKIFKAISRGKQLFLDSFKYQISEQKDQPQTKDQKFVAGC